MMLLFSLVVGVASVVVVVVSTDIAHTLEKSIDAVRLLCIVDIHPVRQRIRGHSPTDVKSTRNTKKRANTLPTVFGSRSLQRSNREKRREKANRYGGTSECDPNIFDNIFPNASIILAIALAPQRRISCAWSSTRYFRKIRNYGPQLVFSGIQSAQVKRRCAFLEISSRRKVFGLREARRKHMSSSHRPIVKGRVTFTYFLYAHL